MSFLTVVEQDATAVETALVTGGKELINYVENVTIIDIVPALEQVLKNAIIALGQEAVAALLGGAVSGNAQSASTPPASS